MNDLIEAFDKLTEEKYEDWKSKYKEVHIKFEDGSIVPGFVMGNKIMLLDHRTCELTEEDKKIIYG
jgi:hypothetical protein